jgi:hypothetical protein
LSYEENKKKMSEEVVTTRIPVFKGNPEQWREWKTKFAARAQEEGYKKVLYGQETVPKSEQVLDSKKDEEALLIKARDRNDAAYSALATACFGTAFACVETAVTSDLPDGDAALAWKNLMDVFEPTNVMAVVKLKKLFHQNDLDDARNDPKTWIQDLERMRARIKAMGETAITDDQMINHICPRSTLKCFRTSSTPRPSRR